MDRPCNFWGLGFLIGNQALDLSGYVDCDSLLAGRPEDTGLLRSGHWQASCRREGPSWAGRSLCCQGRLGASEFSLICVCLTAYAMSQGPFLAHTFTMYNWYQQSLAFDCHCNSGTLTFRSSTTSPCFSGDEKPSVSLLTPHLHPRGDLLALNPLNLVPSTLSNTVLLKLSVGKGHLKIVPIHCRLIVI